MFAVIFKAKTAELDEAYSVAVAKMRTLAFEKYGCLEFFSLSEGDQEVAISYWEDEAAIRRWKNDAEHTLIQALGRSSWYKSYSVQVVEIKREYSFAHSSEKPSKKPNLEQV